MPRPAGRHVQGDGAGGLTLGVSRGQNPQVPTPRHRNPSQPHIPATVAPAPWSPGMAQGRQGAPKHTVLHFRTTSEKWGHSSLCRAGLGRTHPTFFPGPTWSSERSGFKVQAQLSPCDLPGLSLPVCTRGRYPNRAGLKGLGSQSPGAPDDRPLRLCQDPRGPHPIPGTGVQRPYSVQPHPARGSGEPKNRRKGRAGHSQPSAEGHRRPQPSAGQWRLC